METTADVITTVVKEDELKNQPKNTYVGLERLDEIANKEPLWESFVEHITGQNKEEFLARLAEIKVERKELYDKYGINNELWEKYGDTKKLRERGYNIDVGNIKDIKDAKTISKLLIERAADELPPVKEGYIRMFRGEGPHPGTTDDPTIGRWFAHNLQIASCFPLGKLGDSRLSYVDIPETSLAEYHVDNMPEFSGASKGGEYLLPPELVIQAREFIRFLKADTSGDPWSTSQSSNLISSKSM